jgi:hypothetical protein
LVNALDDVSDSVVISEKTQLQRNKRFSILVYSTGRSLASVTHGTRGNREERNNKREDSSARFEVHTALGAQTHTRDIIQRETETHTETGKHERIIIVMGTGYSAKTCRPNSDAIGGALAERQYVSEPNTRAGFAGA